MSDDGRSYHSPLRQQRAAETRDRILDAATAQLAQGASALTIPAVAREAGVAVPTVYRHFPSKEALEDGVADHVRIRAGVLEIQPGAGVDAWLAHSRRTWKRADAQGDEVMAVLLASIGRQLLDERLADRVERVQAVLAPDLEGVDPADAERIAKVVAALSSTPGRVAFKRLGLDADASQDLVDWVIRTLLEAHGGRA
ncbi:MAG: TetR/AcrR family transcriptional regulator [Alphaproteobacteria bacterium]|nr:TetR/AcrR family transcriptional regulator [Alphaproteobacteria bacterium]